MTSTALDLTYAAALAIQPGQIAWDATQKAALSQLGLADAGDGDRSVFLHVCQRTGLDPFARQIYMINRREKVPGTRDNWRDKWTIQTGIDGWRVIRDRAERREGVRGILSRPVYYDPEGSEFKVWVRREPPVAIEMTYTVKDRAGNETPYTSILRMDEYMQMKDGQPIAQWAVKDVHMLEKCTEADVYRKAFPQDFSGIYLDDAMPQDAPAGDAPANGGRPRGRVTVAEVIERGPAEPDSQPDPTSHQAANSQTPAARRNARPATRTSTAPERPAGAVPDETPASGPAAPAGPGPSSSSLYGEDEHDGQAAEDEPGSASADQLQSLHIILGGLGFTGEDREAKLRIAETITGRAPLTGPVRGRSSKNLSYTEARKLVDTLDGFGGDREKLVAWMAGREQAGDDDG
jgi:phage recombination protein Bet